MAMPATTSRSGAPLGPPVETFTSSKTAAVVIALIGLTIAGFVLLGGSGSLTTWTVCIGIAMPFLLWAVWLQSVRVHLHQDGISYASLFGSDEMRWDEIERLYYQATVTTYRLYFVIPIGSSRSDSVKLVDSRGRKIAFGNHRVQRTGELADKLVQLTYPPLFNKAASLYNNGVELDFGSVRLSRTEGVKIRQWLTRKTIPLDQVSGYTIEQGSFWLWQEGKKNPFRAPVADIANVFVLRGILDAVFKRDEPNS